MRYALPPQISKGGNTMKIGDWFKPAILVLAVIFLLIFYQYSENDRYTYHKEISDSFDNRYVVDSRTGIIYGFMKFFPGRDRFYKFELQTGKMWFMPAQIMQGLPPEPKPSHPK
jgi:hypothetical protein